MRVFVSYSWKQGQWVWDRLVPCLKAGGAEVLIDRERLVTGKAVTKQTDAMQGKAKRHVLVLSPDYVSSKPCCHEMKRAIALDPSFLHGIVVPVVREVCMFPDPIAKPNPLYIDLCNDKEPIPWRNLLDACGSDLGADAPEWLRVRDEIRGYLRRGESVSLVVRDRPKWRALVDALVSDDDPEGRLPRLARVDLQSGATVSRRGLVTAIIGVLNGTVQVSSEPHDLVVLDEFIRKGPIAHLALLRFDWAAERSYYGADLFGALRSLVEDRKLVLLIQSRAPLQTLLPSNHPMSSAFTSITTVELNGRP